MNENSQNGRPTFLSVVGSLLLVCLIGGLIFVVVSRRAGIKSYDELRADQRLKNLAELNAANQKILTSYRWVDRKNGVVGIPIDRAMQLELTALQNNHPHPAGPITVAAPSPSPAGSPAKSPAPAAGLPPNHS